MQYKILLTDSDSYNLDILKDYLSEQPYEVVTAETANEAWDLLSRDSSILLILLDADLSGAGKWGLDLLKKIKRDPIFRTRPVIMQTTRINPAELQAGTDLGAKYFLSKPFTKMRFVSLLRASIEEYSHFVSLQESLTKGTLGLQLLESAMFKYRSLAEADYIGLILARVCPEPTHVILGLSELLINAVEHGNLSIGYDLKSQLIQQGLWETEVYMRLKNPEYSNRFVTVQLFRDIPEKNLGFDPVLKIVITDQGKGFDWKKYLEYDPIHALDGHGRGIVTAKQLCFKRMEFNAIGNEVTVWI